MLYLFVVVESATAAYKIEKIIYHFRLANLLCDKFSKSFSLQNMRLYHSEVINEQTWALYSCVVKI